MAKILLHDAAARQALGQGVAKLARAVRGTLGPRGMNAVIDRPIGTPIVSRDGISIAQEIELEDPFENMGAQVLREVAKQTNEVAGDGTTTATVLADALVQQGLACLEGGASPVELVAGLQAGVEAVTTALRGAARPLRGAEEARAVAVISANDERTGALVAEALERIGPDGVLSVEYGTTVETTLDVVEGMSFDRGYLSHHMVTDVERMMTVLDEPDILMTDLKLQTEAEVDAIERLAETRGRPLLVIAEEVAPAAVIRLLRRRERSGQPVAAIHPPEYGHWRKAMLEDLAIITGGRVIARDLGGRLEDVEAADLGGARQVRVTADLTTVIAGRGDPAAIAARRRQVQRQVELAPPNVERDKLETRLAKLGGGSAIIAVGGATPVEQKRRAQLIEDAVNATRAAIADGVVAGGGAALLQAAPALARLESKLSQAAWQGASLLQRALAAPLATIAANAGLNAAEMVARVAGAPAGTGLDARSGQLSDLFAAGVIDPVKVPITALRNAASVAGLILTTDTLVATRPEYVDPTAGPARGGGAERLGRP
ncbi:MAG: molecular chaperone GroEL [Acetobacteraceae bacterium]|nr:molecular chaperone GroEL [Acetobacteraceae bacterium]